MEIDVQIASQASGLPSARDVRAWVRSALVCAGPNVCGDVSVRVVDEDEMRNLNRDYREQDKATNVLAFPAGDVTGLPQDEGQQLGDIVVCAGVVAREAGEQGKQPPDHWGHMLVHGTLHLLGYDHVTESGAVEMERLEREILAGLGIADPYKGN